MAGVTDSTHFPTTMGAFQTANDGNDDGFVTKIGEPIIVPCPTINLDPTALSDGKKGTHYKQRIKANGGMDPYIFTVNSKLPTNLKLKPNGKLVGIPNEKGTFTFEITATDSKGCTGKQTYTLNIK